MSAFHPFADSRSEKRDSKSGLSANDPIADVQDNWQIDQMRFLALALLVVLSACSKVDNTFVVNDAKRSVTSADLELCGSIIPLRRSGDRLSAVASIDCEGSGRINLLYATGVEHECMVGYVTPGAVQSFEFRATEAGCV